MNGLRLCSRIMMDVRHHHGPFLVRQPFVSLSRFAATFNTVDTGAAVLSADNNNNKSNQEEQSTTTTTTIRLSKLVAQCGTNMSMSRREAERRIRDGHVTVAGQVVTSPHYRVNDDQEKAIKVGGKLLQIQRQRQGQHSPPSQTTNASANTRLWIVHKLSGEVVTERDPHGRPSLLERIRTLASSSTSSKKRRHHLKTIGRLDMVTEGLILVTNDGMYARTMELPSNKVHRTYRVRVHGKLAPYKLKAIRSGLTVTTVGGNNNIHYAPMKVQTEQHRRKRRLHQRPSGGTNTWLQITCTEGKNRQIRNVLNHLGLNVTRLIRISYGDYHLQSLPPGMAIEVPVKDVKVQRRVGPLHLVEKKKRKRPNVVSNKQQRVPADNDAATPVRWVRHL